MNPKLLNTCKPGLSLEKRLLKVLKAFAEYRGMSLGDLLKAVVSARFRPGSD